MPGHMGRMTFNPSDLVLTSKQLLCLVAKKGNL
jgi:hypothetical protein